AADSEAAALPDRKRVNAVMASEETSTRIDDFARWRRADLLLNPLTCVAARNEAEILAFRFPGNRQSQLDGEPVDTRLGLPPKGKESGLTLLFVEIEEEVRLILDTIERAPKPVAAGEGIPREPRVVSGRDEGRPDGARDLQ